MTDITLLRFKDGAPKGFKISGHSGYGKSGSDIVCAAVSSASYLTANTLIEVMKLKVEAKVSDGFMEIVIDETEKEKARDVLEGFFLHSRELREQYSKFVKISTEV